MDWLEAAKHRLEISRPVPFSYDRDTRTYRFGDEVKTAAEIPQYGKVHLAGKDDTPREEVDAMIENESVVYTYNLPVMLPRFHKFVRDEWSDDLEREVRSVMAEVLQAPDNLNTSSRDYLGFSATRIDARMGRMVLQVPGMCACFGSDLMVPGWGEYMWGNGISVGTFHNIDWPLQRAALLAGLGHLALKSK